MNPPQNDYKNSNIQNRFTVKSDNSDYNSSPTYSENGNVITVLFAGGIKYDIYAIGADMGAVEYIVNSLYQ